MNLSRPLTDRHEICTQVLCGVKPSLKAYFQKIFYPPLKTGAGKRQISCMEAHKFETAQHKKQIFHLQ